VEEDVSLGLTSIFDDDASEVLDLSKFIFWLLLFCFCFCFCCCFCFCFVFLFGYFVVYYYCEDPSGDGL
jgi:hypothetical protein